VRQRAKITRGLAATGFVIKSIIINYVEADIHVALAGFVPEGLLGSDCDTEEAIEGGLETLVAAALVGPTKAMYQVVTGEVDDAVGVVLLTGNLHKSNVDLLVGGYGQAELLTASNYPDTLDGLAALATDGIGELDRLYPVGLAVGEQRKGELSQVHLVATQARRPDDNLAAAFISAPCREFEVVLRDSHWSGPPSEWCSHSKFAMAGGKSFIGLK